MASTLTLVIWGVLVSFLVALIFFLVLTSRKKSDKTKDKPRFSLKLILTGGVFAGIAGILSYLALLPLGRDGVAIKFPSTGLNLINPTILQCTKNLYSTPTTGLVTTFLLASIVFLTTILFRNVFINKRIEKDLENAKMTARNFLEDLQIERLRLAEANAKNEAILYSIGDGVFAIDTNQKIIMFNDVASKISGFKSEEVIGKNYRDILKFVREKDGTVNDSFIIETIQSGVSKAMDIGTILITKDGRKIPVADSAAPFKNIDGKVVGCVVVFRDITKEKELDRAKNEFISIASHQLRTPLIGIRWVIERFTEKEKLTPVGKGYLNDLYISVNRLSELVDLLLNLSRIEAGQYGMTFESLDIIIFIKDFLNEVSSLRDKRGLKITFDNHPKELVIKIDKSVLRNIVQSLISNAIEYTPKGGEIDIIVKKEKDKFILKIIDTGIGIPEGEQAHIFDKFVRASNAKLYKTDGTGIGLYIAERATSLLGGKIWFESEENKGSSFYVEFPLKSQSSKK